MSKDFNPSDLKKRLNEVESKIDYYRNIKESITDSLKRQEKNFFDRSYSCPECGSEEDRKIKGGIHHKTATCEKCGFNAMIFD